MFKNADLYWEEYKRMLEWSENDFFSDGETLKGLKALRKTWERNKAWLAPYFDEDGRKIIAVTPEIQEVTDGLFNSALEMARNSCYTIRYKQNSRFACVDAHELERTCKNYLTTYFTRDEIADNKLKTSTVLNYDTNKTACKGMKVSKLLAARLKHDSRYAFQPDNTSFNKFLELGNIYYSLLVMYLNRTFSVALSINPVDFLTVSAHTTGWHSCHNFVGGAHKTGALAYMLDDVSVVAYAFNEMKYYLGEDDIQNYHYNKNKGLYVSEAGIKLPVKLWRQMVFLDTSNKSAITSRHYPLYAPQYEKFSRMLAAEILSKECDVPYSWYVKTNGDDTLENSKDEDGDDTGSFGHLFDGGFFYKDSPTSRIKMKSGGRAPEITAGTDTLPCIVCGKTRENDNSTHDGSECNYTCLECYNKHKCSECGNYVKNPVTYNDHSYCQSCYDYKFPTCIHCGARHPISLMKHVRNDEYVCDTCLPEFYRYCFICKSYHPIEDCSPVPDRSNSNLRTIDYYACKNCIESGAVIKCDKCGEWSYYPKETPLGTICKKCARTHLEECSGCGRFVLPGTLTTIDDCNYCDFCIDRSPRLKDMLRRAKRQAAKNNEMEVAGV
jgi:hypothetical protein